MKSIKNKIVKKLITVFLPTISIPYKNTYNKNDYNLVASFGESWKATPKALKATTRHGITGCVLSSYSVIKLNMLLMIFKVDYT